MALVLATGLPGFLLFFLHLLPWSALAVSGWALAAFAVARLDARRSPEPMPAGAWGCVSLPIMLSIAVAPFAEAWHPVVASLAFWGAPTLLGVLAASMAAQAWRRDQRMRAALLFPLLYQFQLMFCGGLFAFTRLFSGGSPI